MSLYNMLHGFEQTASLVLSLLNLQQTDVPRFRDAYVTYRDLDANDPNGALIMVVLTRTGGANREDFVEENARLRLLSGYMDDADDEFDSTFAHFRYRLPITDDGLTADLRNYLIVNGPPLSLRQKTEQATGPEQTLRQRKATEQIARALMEKMGVISRL